jgi:hypothetical protein
MFANRMKMALLTIVIASSVIGVSGIVSSASADTRKDTNQSYLSLPITVGGQSETADDDSGDDDGPPPAVLHKDRPSSPMSHTDYSSDDDGPPPAVLHKDRPSSPMSHTDYSSDDDGPPPAVLRNEKSHGATSEDSDWTTADNNTIPEKNMKGLSNCETTAAADGHLTLVEIMDCFYKYFKKQFADFTKCSQ